MKINRLEFSTKNSWSYLGGAGAVLFGAGAIWLAVSYPKGENAWVPWVVGVFFGTLGIFTLLSRTKVVFDSASRRWTDSFGFLFFKFTDTGSFDQLEKIYIEESEGTRGVITHYIYVKGRPDVQVMVDIAIDDEEARRIAEELQSVLDLPVKTIQT